MTWNVTTINYLAVFIAALASFAVGAVWYGILFGKTWPRLYDYGEEKLQAMAKTQVRTFVIFFIADVVTAFGVAILLNNLEVASVSTGVMLALTLWLAAGVTNAATQKAAHRQSLSIWAMDAGHHLLSLLAISAILGAWR